MFKITKYGFQITYFESYVIAKVDNEYVAQSSRAPYNDNTCLQTVLPSAGFPHPR